MDLSRLRRSLPPHSPLRRKPHDLLPQYAALVGPDTLPEEPVKRLEGRIAGLLGKPAALFFPSGTMAQQVALRVHAERTGRKAFGAHPYVHLDTWELQGYGAVHGLRFHPAGDRFRLLSSEDVAGVREPLAAFVWELPQRDLGGVLPEWDDLVEQVGTARARGAAAHLDGARLFEAQTFYGRPHAEIAALFDTVYISLYKGLLGARGAVLTGDEETVAEAGVWRKRLGGAVDDAWPLALGPLLGLDRLLPRMGEFRDYALAIAEALAADGVARTVPDPPQTPVFHVVLPVSPEAAQRASAEILDEHGVLLFRRALTGPDPSRCAFEVTVSENAMEFTAQEVAALVRELVDRA